MLWIGGKSLLRLRSSINNYIRHGRAHRNESLVDVVEMLRRSNRLNGSIQRKRSVRAI